MVDVGVFDTSPLQALHRGGILAKTADFCARSLVPRAVADETRWSHRKLGSKLVPDLSAYPNVGICAISNDVLRETMISLFRAFERGDGGGKRASRRTPEIVEYQGKIYAWSSKLQLTHAIPDLEVVVLAKQLGGVAIVDDSRAIRAADDLGVGTVTTREIIAELEARGVIANSTHVLGKIEATGYIPARRAPRP